MRFIKVRRALSEWRARLRLKQPIRLWWNCVYPSCCCPWCCSYCRQDYVKAKAAKRISSALSSSPAITQALITALKDVKHELFWLDCVCATPGGSVDLAQTLRLAGVLRKTIKALKLAALAFAEKG